MIPGQLNTVLIVEADERRAQWYKYAMRDRGCAVVHVRTARAALRYLHGRSFDSVCLFGAEVNIDTALPVLQSLDDTE